jgi:hypothetical protein
VSHVQQLDLAAPTYSGAAPVHSFKIPTPAGAGAWAEPAYPADTPVPRPAFQGWPEGGEASPPLEASRCRRCRPQWTATDCESSEEITNHARELVASHMVPSPMPCPPS